MAEKTNKIKLPKYSSYLTDNDSKLLDSFCSQFDCSKAKALPLLLKFWNDNKDKVSNELAIISSEDISAKKYDERLATIEDKLANISYDTELATIKERLATLENMLASIADNEAVTESEISSNCDNEDEDIPLEKSPITIIDITSLKDEERDILERMKEIKKGEIFDSQNKLATSLGVNRSALSKLKSFWENKIFSVENVNGTHKLTRL